MKVKDCFWQAIPWIITEDIFKFLVNLGVLFLYRLLMSLFWHYLEFVIFPVGLPEKKNFFLKKIILISIKLQFFGTGPWLLFIRRRITQRNFFILEEEDLLLIKIQFPISLIFIYSQKITYIFSKKLQKHFHSRKNPWYPSQINPNNFILQKNGRPEQ